MYALDEGRILRVLRTEGELDRAIDYHIGRAQLCDEVRPQLPFALPRLLDHGIVGDEAYTIEERIPGRSLDSVLVDLDGAEREDTLRAFADTALALGTVRVERPWFGEFLFEPTIRRDSWPAYLLGRAAAQVGRAGEQLRRDVDELGAAIDRFRDAVTSLDVAPGFVHGDFFPGNLMVDGTTVTGVLDLGFSTVVGDPRLDLAGAAAFLEVDRPWCRPGDAELVRSHLTEREPSLAHVEATYRTYVALFFSFTHEFGVPLYDWCVETLRKQGS